MAATLSKTLYQAGKKSAVSVAQQIAQNAKHEADKTLESVKAQTGIPVTEKGGRPEQTPVPEVVQQIRETGPENIDRESLKLAEQSTIARLENELQMMMQKRDEQSKRYNQQVEAQMQQTQAAPQVEAAAPQGKIRKAMGQAKKAVTSILQGKKQQESKQGSGKG